MTLRSSVAESAPSLAESRNIYVPGVEKLAVVFRELASPNATVPGPLNLVQANDSIPGGIGRPSSRTAPSSDTPAGRVTVWSAPALTTGPWFGGKAEPESSRSKMMSLLLALA